MDNSKGTVTISLEDYEELIKIKEALSDKKDIVIDNSPFSIRRRLYVLNDSDTFRFLYEKIKELEEDNIRLSNSNSSPEKIHSKLFGKMFR